MSHPDPDADFVEQVLAAVRRLAAPGGGSEPVTDLRVADATGLHLPTVRAVLAEEDGRTVRVERAGDREPWRVRPCDASGTGGPESSAPEAR